LSTRPTACGPRSGLENGGWQNLDGEIDDVRIDDRALTPGQVQALYSQPWK
jgi:hypothetical protein